MQPNVNSVSIWPVSTSYTSSIELKQDPPGRVSHVPFSELYGQCPSQRHCNVLAARTNKETTINLKAFSRVGGIVARLAAIKCFRYWSAFVGRFQNHTSESALLFGFKPHQQRRINKTDKHRLDQTARVL